MKILFLTLNFEICKIENYVKAKDENGCNSRS